MADPDEPFSVLPFKIGKLVNVLLMMSEGDDGWRLPSGGSRKGLSRHASAALAAERQAGVSGQIYKRPIYPDGQTRRMGVYPLLVRTEKRASRSSEPVTLRWFPLMEAADLVEADLRPSIESFAQRIERHAHCRQASRARGRS